MSRRITLTSLCATLTVVIVLAIVVMSAKGQTTAVTVKGFPFAQIGKAYEIGTYPLVLKITKDLGNGWVEAKTISENRTAFVNLNQASVLVPRD